MQSPVLAMLRRLEAQNIWRAASGAWAAPPPLGSAPLSAAAASEPAAAPSAAASAAAATTSGLPNWWEDSDATAQDAMRLLVARIRAEGPVKQAHLQHLFERVATPDELERALRLTRLNYLARSELRQHAPFSARTGAAAVGAAMRLGAPALGARAAGAAGAELGLPAPRPRQLNRLLVYHSKVGDLAAMLDAYEGMKAAGPRPDAETAFVLVKGCVDAGRPDLAALVLAEFEGAGVRVREGTRAYLARAQAAAAAAAGGAGAARAAA
jgi:hypothetical protein